MIDEMKALIEKLNTYTKAYDEGKTLISDHEWDGMYYRLQDLEKLTGIVFPNSPTHSIHYETINELTKVKHNHPMLSLDKTKDWNEFLTHFLPGKDVVGMLKMDGMTCSLRYLNGELVSAESRGNGEIGNDIFHHIKVMNNVPQIIPYNEELIVDGEIICTYNNFENFKNEFSNPRNMVAGSMNLLDAKESARRNLQFVAWYVPKGPWKTMIESFVELAKLGFEVTPWTSSFDWDAADFLKDKAVEYGYPIDGLVGRYDDIAFGESLGATEHHARAAYAFKFFDEEYETELLNIEWTMGRTGKLTPVACFKEVEASGAMVSKANLHNVSIMKELFNGLPYEGDIVSVYRANDVIPQISKVRSPLNQAQVLLPIPDTCPYCGGRTEIVKEIDSEVLMCTNSECEGKLINKLLHFVSKKGLDIKGLSEATLEKLIDWEWVANPIDLYDLRAHEAEWKKKPGFGVKSVENILNAITASKNPTLQSFLSAIGIPLIGRTASKELVKYFNTYEEFRNAVKDDKYSFVQLDGFAGSKANNIKNFNYTEADKLYEILGPFQEVEKNKIDDSSELAGATVVITGKLVNWKNRSQLQSIVESKGGKVVNSISKNTTFLINNDKNSRSAKNIAANKLGIPIITEDEFITRYL